MSEGFWETMYWMTTIFQILMLFALTGIATVFVQRYESQQRKKAMEQHPSSLEREDNEY